MRRLIPGKAFCLLTSPVVLVPKLELTQPLTVVLVPVWEASLLPTAVLAAATLLLVMVGSLSLSLVMPGNLLLATGTGLPVLGLADKLKGLLANLERLLCPSAERGLLLCTAALLAVEGGGAAMVGGVPGLFSFSSTVDKPCTGV